MSSPYLGLGAGKEEGIERNSLSRLDKTHERSCNEGGGKDLGYILANDMSKRDVLEEIEDLKRLIFRHEQELSPQPQTRSNIILHT